MKITRLLPFLFFLTGFFIQSPGKSDFQLDVYKSNLVAIIEWEKEAEEKIKGYTIYISGGNQTEFPQSKVAEIEGDANYWVSKERRTLALFDDLFGVSLRDYTQWRDQEVLTPGEFYTVGVEKVFIDNTSERSDPHVIIPCEKETIDIEELSETPREIIDPIHLDSLRNQIFASPYANKMDDGLDLNIYGTHYLIDHIEEGSNFYYLFAQNEIVKCEKIPNRPTIYGDSSLIFLILKFQLFCLIVIALYFLFITGKAVHYLNFLALDVNDSKEIIKTIIQQESSSVFILYFIVLIAKNYFSNKLIQVLISEICANNQHILNAIAEVFNTHKIYQFAQIKTAILSIVS